MSRSLSGLVEFVKAVTNSNASALMLIARDASTNVLHQPSDVDPKVVEMPWREE